VTEKTAAQRLAEAEVIWEERRQRRAANPYAPQDVDASTQKLIDQIHAGQPRSTYVPEAPPISESTKVLVARAMGRPYPEPEPEPTKYQIRPPVSPYSAPEPDLSGGDDDL